MAQENNDNITYLKALRQPVGAPAAAAAAPAREPAAMGANEAGEPQPYAGPEKRRSPRFKCEGSIEMREPGHDVRTWATFKDISLHGCYVEASATYPVGTVLDLKLEANGFQVRAKGTVRVCYPFLGMGIALIEMAEADRASLKQLLGTISRPAVVMGAPLLASGPLEPAPLIADPTAALRALVEFFEKRQTLPREEFLRILRKSQEVAAKPAQSRV
jgi:PilZ domain